MCNQAEAVLPAPPLDLNSSAFDYGGVAGTPFAEDRSVRFWDAAAVEKSRAVLGDSDRLLRFLKKLYAGEAVTVVAVGSSVVKDHSGCFGPPDLLQRKEAESWSGLIRRHLQVQCGPASPEAEKQIGYMTHFMAALNATWPHPEHRYLNVGRGGTTANAWCAMCLHQILPPDMDLIILEQFTLHSKPWHFEFLLRSMLSWPSQPAVVAYNHRTKSLEDRKLFRPCYRALWKDLPNQISNPDACRNPKSADKEWMALDVNELLADPPLVEYHDLASHYGVPSVSMGFMLADVEERGLAVEAGLRPVHVHALLYDEYLIHPTRLHGKIAVADMLLQVLLNADRELGGLCAERAVRDEAVAPLPEKLYRETRDQILHQQCYEPGLADASVDTHLMDIAYSKEFRYIEMTTAGDRHKRKPGFVTDAAKARLDIRLPTLFPGFLDGKVAIAVTYLKSYEHMGQARVECAGGCGCGQTIIDAHTAVQQSANEVATLKVATPGPDCVLRVTTLNDTSSGEHKFKVEQVAVRVS